MFCAKIAQHFSPGLRGQFALLRLARSAPRSLRLYHLTRHLGGEVLEVQGPAFAESISEGDIRWNKQVGDFVKTDEIVAEIETDKTSVEVPAPFSGKIVELLVEEGGKVTAKQNLYKMEKGENGGTADEGPKTATEVPKKLADEEAPPKVEKPKSTGAAPSHPSKVPPMPKEPISSKPVSEIKVPKFQQQQQPPPKPKAIAEAGKSTAITGQRSETHVKMNRMRLRIAERLKEAQNTNAMLTTFNEVDLHNVVNMRKQYQEAFTKKHGVKLGLMSPFVRASAIALQEQPVVNAVIEGTEIIYRNFVDISIAVATPRGLVVPVRSETHVKMNRMRLRIAERLKEAQNTNAMLTTFNEVDLHNVVNMRKQYQEAFTKKHGVKLGLMSPFVRASAIALQEQPVVNAVIEGTEIIYRNFVDISIAVATPRGLVVPVVRNVEAMSYADIEKTLGELGVKAGELHRSVRLGFSVSEAKDCLREADKLREAGKKLREAGKKL
uniref:Dihydrolipoamide acetyltransferase component of pyruvate dehydrogenase complex n=1 Tax=Globodera pallida TaxID=36090 RepID=A0A183BSQ5_GLOPA